MTRMRRTATATLLAAATGLGATGCWPQPGGNAGGQNYNGLESVLTAETVTSLSAAWSTSGRVTAVWGGTAYGVADGELRAIDVDSGAEVWAATIPVVPAGTAEALSGPAVVGDGVGLSYSYEFLAPPEGQPMTASAGLTWDRATGELDAVLSNPPAPGTITWTTVNLVPSSELVAFETTNGLLHVASTDTGPAPGGGTVQVHTHIWQAATAATAVPPVFAGDALVDADGGTLRSFVAAGCGTTTCAPTWAVDLGVPVSALATGPGGLVFAVLDATDTAPAALAAVDRASGAVAWRADLPLGSMAPAVVGDTVYVTAGDQVRAYRAAGCGAATCGPLWMGPLPGAARGNLAAAGDLLYAGSADGTVSAFALAGCGGDECAPLAAVTIDAAPETLLVAAGHLVVGLADGGGTTVFAPGG